MTGPKGNSELFPRDSQCSSRRSIEGRGNTKLTVSRGARRYCGDGIPTTTRGKILVLYTNVWKIYTNVWKNGINFTLSMAGWLSHVANMVKVLIRTKPLCLTTCLYYHSLAWIYFTLTFTTKVCSTFVKSRPGSTNLWRSGWLEVPLWRGMVAT